ncbi:FecCD family ABC transporter permease [Paenarthrobacter sp. NCHU4564]|uniref:FecCD family ABC transporter permease n=1 Tax=Paenarthrobacter sp. NCHU4564 TaxID=3451353 RepID=UPI003F9C0E5B
MRSSALTRTRPSLPKPGSRLRRRILAAILVAVVLVSVLTLLGGLGHPLPLDRLVAVLEGSGTTSEKYLVTQIRLPRLVVAVLVGACMGLAGAIFQNLTRNPLGSPDVVGINDGAATGALLVILVMHAGETATPLGALLGGLAAGAVVFVLAARRGVKPMRLVLAGIAVAPLLTAFNSYLLIRADVDSAENASRWLVGSLGGAEWGRVSYLGLSLAVCTAAVLLLKRSLDNLSLGDELATSLGVRILPVRVTAGLAGIVLAATATAASGPIGFVSLTAPHLARWIHPGGFRPVTSAVTGASILVGSDFLATYTSTAIHLPVGAVTGLLGGIYLALYLGISSRRGIQGH